MAYGTHTLADLIANKRQSVIEYGEDRILEVIQSYLAAHNRELDDMTATLVERTTDRYIGTGGLDEMTMDELDEFGRADAEKVSTGDAMGFPLRMYGRALQWTRLSFENMTPSDIAMQTQALATADIVNVQKQIKIALFRPTNVTFVDKLMPDRAVLPVKALVNGDGMALPIGPNREMFDAGTHTHYLARAAGSVAASDIDRVLDTVAEHVSTGRLMLYINRADEGTIRGFKGTGEFLEYLPATIVQGANVTQIATPNLDVMNLGNRAIGMWKGKAEIWVKPWIPANYFYAWVQGAAKPLAMRERRAGSGAFQLHYENENFPLRARQMGREFGVAVRNRVNGAILYTNGTTYVQPAF